MSILNVFLNQCFFMLYDLMGCMGIKWNRLHHPSVCSSYPAKIAALLFLIPGPVKRSSWKIHEHTYRLNFLGARCRGKSLLVRRRIVSRVRRFWKTRHAIYTLGGVHTQEHLSFHSLLVDAKTRRVSSSCWFRKLWFMLGCTLSWALR